MDKTNSVKINIKAQTTKATSEIKRLNAEMKKMGKSARRGNRDLKAQTAQLNQTTRSFASLTKHISQLAIIYGAFRGLQTTVRTFAEFEASISRLGVISGATSTQLKEMKEKSEELGGTTVFTASQVAEGMNSMAMAGLSADESLTAIGSTLSLASIGQIDVAESSLIATRAMNGFGLEAKDMGRISDVMAKAVTTSATTITQLGLAYRKVASVATQFGNSIEETTAILGVMADAGRVGAEAGTQLKIAMLRLSANPEVKKYLQELSEASGGLSTNMYDATGAVKPFIEQLQTLKDATAGLSEEARNLHLSRIVGSEAVASFNVAINNLDEIRNKTYALEDSFGFASKTAKELTDNLKGDFAEFNSALEILIITLGTGLSPVLRDLLDEATEFLQTLDPEEVKEFGAGIGELAIVLSDMVKAVTSITGAIGSFSKSITNLTGVSGSAQVELLLLSVAMSKMFKVAKSLVASYAVVTAGTTALTTAMAGIGVKVSMFTILFGKLRYAIAGLIILLKANWIGVAVTAFAGLIAVFSKLTSNTNAWNKALEKMELLSKNNTDAIDTTTESLEALSTESREAFGSYIRDQISNTEKAIITLTKKLKEQLNAYIGNEDAVHALGVKLNTYGLQITSLKEKEQQLIKINTKKIKQAREEADSIEKKTEVLNANRKAIEKAMETISGKEATAYNNIIKNLNGRVSKTQNTLLTLYNKESKHKDALIKIEAELQKARAKYATDRKQNALSYESEVFDIKNQGATDLARYTKTQTRLAKLASDAEKAYVKGNFAEFELLATEFNNLRKTYNGQEISHQEEVKKLDRATGKYKLESIKKIDVATSKAQTSSLANAKIGLKFADMSAKVELDNAKALAEKETANANAKLKIIRMEMALQLATLEILIKMQEVALGVKINADLSIFKQQIAEMDMEINKVANEKREAKLFLALERGGTDAEINALRQLIETPTPLLITIEADEAVRVAEKAKDAIEKKPIEKKLSLNVKQAIDKAESTKKDIEKTPIQWEAQMDLVKAKKDLTDLRGEAEKHTRSEFKFLLAKAEANILRLRKIASGDIIVNVYERYHPAPRPRKQDGGMIYATPKLPRFDTGGHLDNGKGHSRKSGKLSGYGGGDKVKALLEAGEFIIRKEAVKALGLARLHLLNQGELPRYQAGGHVSPIQRFNTGGAVDTPTNKSNKSIDLNLSFGGQTFKMMTEEEVAISLAKHLERSTF